MPVFFLVFEFLGTTELIVIAAVALLIFGPRKLPEIGRTIGRSLAEFKRASEDFKRTWEYEVEMERSERETRAAPTYAQTDAPPARAALPEADATEATAAGDWGDGVSSITHDANEEYTVARGATDDAVSSLNDDDRAASPAAADDAATQRPAEESSAAGGKKDWL